MSVLENVDLRDTQIKLYERLKPSGWGDVLKTFLLSTDFESILETLLKQAKEGKRFTPQLKLVFKAFEECPLKDLKVVVIGQDPYPQPYTASGIAFSCDVTGKPEKSLKYIFKAIEDTVYKDGYLWDPDLTRWSNQGILLINTALTTEMNKTGTHYELWKPFLTFLLDYLTIQNPGLVYAFLGKKAQDWAESIPDNNYKLMASHPASAAYKELAVWDCDDIFNKISTLVHKQFNEKIVW
jgi:uracil-DNA glycosylase